MAFGPLPVLAQSGGESVQRVEVTGSLIRRIDSETSLPVTTIRSEDLQRVGVTNAEQAVQFITQQQGGTVTSGSVSGTNGAAAYADLRSLGAQRTLVLLNGKRVVSNPFATVAVDLNTLPMAAVDRIETLSDGASSIYGTDAIAGVINFITRRDYQGGAVSAQAQVTEAGGGDVYTGGLLLGLGDINTQGWNVFGSLNVRQQKPLGGLDREFARTSYIPSRGFNGTSPTTFPANYSQTVGTTTTVANTNPSLAAGCEPPTSIPIPEANGTTIRCFADTQAFTQTSPEQDQASLFLRGSLALGADHRASLEFFHGYNKVTQQIAPSPEAGLQIFPDSPFYPGNGAIPITNTNLNVQQPISVSWRTTVLGARRGQQENNTQRLVAGLEGAVAGWDYQTHVLWSKAEVVNEFLNGYPMTNPLRAGTRGCVTAPTVVNGVVNCSEPLVFNGQRVYLNPFGEQTEAGLAYLRANQVLGEVQRGESEMASWTGSISRTFGNLAGGPIAVAAALELRKEEMVYRTDVPLVSQAASSGLAGSGALRQGDRDIKAVAVEANFPILKSLEIGAAVRMDKYSDFGDTVNPKVSLRFTPNEKVLVRASANTGFAAPSLYQLYLPNSTTFTSTRYNDPVLCPGGTAAPTGIPSRDCGLQFQQLQGGNANLEAEESTAWTAGIVLQPTREFSFGLDFWSYHVENSIGVTGEQTIFGDPTKYASLFVRCSQAPADRRAAIGACNVSDASDALAYIVNTNQNLGDTRTSGVDLQANYATGATSFGRFNFSLRGSYVHKYRFQVERNGNFFDANGNYSPLFGGPVIRYQQVTSLNWDNGPWSMLFTHRHVHRYFDQNGTSVAAGFRNNVVKNYDTLNISATYRGIKGLTLSGAVLNVFDVDPPFSNQVSRFQARAYDDRFASPLGRAYQVSARYEF